MKIFLEKLNEVAFAACIVTAAIVVLVLMAGHAVWKTLRKSNMSEKNLNEVSPACRGLYKRGHTLLDQGNLTDAIDVFNQVLNEEPGLVAGREALRTAQLARAERNEGFFKHQFEEIGAAALLMEAELCLGAHPLKAMGLAEQVLNHEPKSLGAHKIFAKAALKADLPRTALLSLNFVASHAPETPEVALEIVSALKQAGRATEALSICGRLLKDYPGNKRVARTLGSLYTSERSRLASTLPGRRHYDPNAGSRRVSGVYKPFRTGTIIF